MNIPQHGSVRSRSRASATLLFCVCVAEIFAGCAARNNQVPARNTAAVVHPKMPATMAPRPTPLTDETVDPVPELRLELPPPPPLLASREAPARPRVAPAPERETSIASKPEAPVIAPQMTPAETNAARQQMVQSLSVAEKNLARSRGRALNVNQSDLASKIRGFIGDAQSAGKEGDWTRARSLATKAEVLSEELAASL